MKRILPFLISLSMTSNFAQAADAKSVEKKTPAKMKATPRKPIKCAIGLMYEKAASDDAAPAPEKVLKKEPVKIIAPTTPSIAPVKDPNLAVGQGFLHTGLRQLQEVAAQQEGKSFVYSPLSLFSAMALLTAGAKAETEKALIQYLLATESDPATLTKGLKAFYQRYKAAADAAAQSGQKIIPFEFVGAQAVVSNKDIFSLDEGYARRIKEDYDSEIFHKTFDPSILGFINGWVSEKTKNLIPKLLEQPLKPDVVLVILNAIYAKGSFAKSFELMEEGRFKAADGTSTPVTYLNRVGSMPFAKTKNWTATQISMKAGAPVTIDLLLPNEASTDPLTLTPAEYAEIVEEFEKDDASSVRVNLTLPANKIESKIDFTRVLMAPGHQVPIFDGDQPNLSGLGRTKGSNDPLAVSQVIQKAVLEVNPFGFEGAAATAILVMRSTAFRPTPSTEPIPFTMNRPGLMIVRDVETKLPLFVQYVNGGQHYSKEELAAQFNKADEMRVRITFKDEKGAFYASEEALKSYVPAN
ncbi:MAG: hypothetical protein KA116_00730 [Proteobacteria bacterium]|nr:hypothetical protein [Pseudomonadota bacterium]